MSEDILKNIQIEVNKTGFPLELRVANYLRAENYYVHHSVYYIDYDEGKSREIDIRAIMNRTFDDEDSITKKVFVRNCLVIECKKSENKPWVFLSSDRERFDVMYDEIYKWQRKNKSVFSFSVIDKVTKIHPFNQYSKIARSYFEAFKGNEANDTIFKAITSVVKACAYFNRDETDTNIEIMIPIIVFDGQLFEGELNELNQIEVKEVESVLINFTYPMKDRDERFVIPIMKEEAFKEFIKKIIPTLDILIDDAEVERHFNKEMKLRETQRVQ